MTYQERIEICQGGEEEGQEINLHCSLPDTSLGSQEAINVFLTSSPESNFVRGEEGIILEDKEGTRWHKGFLAEVYPSSFSFLQEGKNPLLSAEGVILILGFMPAEVFARVKQAIQEDKRVYLKDPSLGWSSFIVIRRISDEEEKDGDIFFSLDGLESAELDWREEEIQKGRGIVINCHFSQEEKG